MLLKIFFLGFVGGSCNERGTGGGTNFQCLPLIGPQYYPESMENEFWYGSWINGP